MDQSTKKTGWAIFENGSFCKCGLIDCDRGKHSPVERFSMMCKTITDFIDREHPEYLVMEGLAYQRNAATLIELAQLQGVIIGMCLKCQIEFYIYPASSWRKMLCFQQGKGIRRPDLKRQAQAYAKRTYGLDLDEDTADAVSIGSAFNFLFYNQ